MGFRALHHTGAPFVIPNPWDVGSAKMLAALGFKALATTSAGMAFAQGCPEGRITKEQTLDHCRDLVAATPLPVSADLENGFVDDPEGVAQTVRDAAATGLAGCSIEDYTGDAADPLYEDGLALARIEAAVEAARAQPGEFVLTARCESFLWGGTDLNFVIRRLQAFDAAGADVLYAPGLYDLETIRTVCGALDKPVNVVMGMPGATFTVADLAEAGVARISVGSAFARLAYGKLVSAAEEILGEGSFTFSEQAAGFAKLDGLLSG